MRKKMILAQSDMEHNHSRFVHFQNVSENEEMFLLSVYRKAEPKSFLKFVSCFNPETVSQT